MIRRWRERPKLSAPDRERPPYAEEELKTIIARYNHERLHSCSASSPSGLLPGDPTTIDEQRRLKLRQARHRCKEENLKNPSTYATHSTDRQLPFFNRKVPLSGENKSHALGRCTPQ